MKEKKITFIVDFVSGEDDYIDNELLLNLLKRLKDKITLLITDVNFRFIIINGNNKNSLLGSERAEFIFRNNLRLTIQEEVKEMGKNKYVVLLTPNEEDLVEGIKYFMWFNICNLLLGHKNAEFIKVLEYLKDLK